MFCFHSEYSCVETASASHFNCVIAHISEKLQDCSERIKGCMKWPDCLPACTEQLASPHFTSATLHVVSSSTCVATISVTKLSNESFPSCRTWAMFVFCFFLCSIPSTFSVGGAANGRDGISSPYSCFITEERCSLRKVGVAHKSADSSKWYQLLLDKHKHPRSTWNITVCIGLFGSLVRILILWNWQQRRSLFSELWKNTETSL